MAKTKEDKYVQDFVRQCRASTGYIEAKSEKGFVDIYAKGDPYAAMTIAERLMDKFAQKEGIPFETLLESLTLLHKRNSEKSIVYIYRNYTDYASVAKVPKRVRGIKEFVDRNEWLMWDRPDENKPFEILIEKNWFKPEENLNKFIDFCLKAGAGVKIKDEKNDDVEWEEVNLNY